MSGVALSRGALYPTAEPTFFATLGRQLQGQPVASGSRLDGGLVLRFDLIRSLNAVGAHHEGCKC